MKSHIQYWSDTMFVNKILCAQLYIICCGAAPFLILQKNIKCHWICSEFICISVYLLLGKIPAFCNGEILQSVNFVPSTFCTG